MYSLIAILMPSSKVSLDNALSMKIFHASSERHLIVVSENGSKLLARRQIVPRFEATPSNFPLMIGANMPRQTSLKLLEVSESMNNSVIFFILLYFLPGLLRRCWKSRKPLQLMR